MIIRFYRCNYCGNIIIPIQDSGVNPVCCNESMEDLVANSTDAAGEKHVPIIEKSDHLITVKVGSTPHPMSSDHRIAWIALVTNNALQAAKLTPEAAPEATFSLASPSDDAKAYTYCNLHGLWVSESAN